MFIVTNQVFFFFTAADSVELTSHLELPVGEHSFSQMHGDLDQQRLLGERPSADPLAEFIVKEMRSKERYISTYYVDNACMNPNETLIFFFLNNGHFALIYIYF